MVCKCTSVAKERRVSFIRFGFFLYGAGVFIAALAVLSLPMSTLQALGVGSRVTNVKLRTASDKPSWIPYLGKRVLVVFYTDPDVADQNDPFADLLKASNLSKKIYKGVGVANMKDTWKPNSIIRMVIRRKIKKYKSTILTDPSNLLKKAWGLGNSNDKSIVIVIGKDRKVYYFRKGYLNALERKKAFAIIKDLIRKEKASE